jgi:protein-disulfide isomerase
MLKDIAMLSPTRLVAAAAICAAALFAPGAARAQNAQSITPAQRTEIEAIVKDYLIRNPDVLQEMIAALEKHQAHADAAKAKAVIAAHKDALFNSPHQVTLGNPKGDVTLVEFFDYNCGYCKRAMTDMLQLLKNDPNLRIVLRELPVLGQGSLEAAQVAAALNMQDKSGQKYLAFHQQLLGGRGQVDRARALAAAKEAGADMARLEKDIEGPKVREALAESLKLAEALGLNGTPSYVLSNDEVLIGAVGASTLREKINTARCGQISC